MNKIKNSLACLIFLLSACQQTPQPPEAPQTIDNIIYQGQFLKSHNPVYLSELVRKIQENQGLKIKIFGDSHTAGDFFSDELRSLLFNQADVPGFLYPLQPKYHQNITASYQQKNFKIFNSLYHAKEDYPLGGVIATAQKKNAFIRLTLNTRYTQQLTSTIIFRSPNQKTAFKITDAQGKTYLLKASSPNKWNFFTRQLSYPIQITALQKNVSLGGYFITNDPYDNLIDTAGINGASSNIWKRWNLDLMRRELFEIRYDLVIIAYGTNDIIANLPAEKITSNIKALITLIQESNPQVPILILTPPTVTIKEDHLRKIPENFHDTQQALLDFAKQENLLVFDTHAFMEGNGGKEIWIIKNLSKPDTHLTPLGYRFVARKIFQEIHALIQHK